MTLEEVLELAEDLYLEITLGLLGARFLFVIYNSACAVAW